MSRFAGLEIDRSRLRLAIFDGNPKKYTLVNFIDEDISAESEEERRELIREILREQLAMKENRGIDLVSSIDARQSVLREISVPYTKDDAIAKTIRFEAESYLHAYSVDDVVIEYLKCGETEAGSRLLLCAVQKGYVASHLDELQSAEIDPVAIELDATAIANSFASTPLYSGEQNVLLVEVQQDYTRMVFLEKDKLVKIRSFWNPTAPRETRSERLLDSAGETPSPVPSVADDPFADDGFGGGDIERRFEEIEKSLLDLDPGDVGELGLEDIPIAVISDDEYARLTENDSPESTRSKPSGADLFMADDSDDADDRHAATGDLASADTEELTPPKAPAPAVPVAAGATSSPVEASTVSGRARFVVAPGVDGAAADGDAVDRLILEIERTFAAYVMNHPIDLVVVTGSAAERLDVVGRIGDRFEVDTVPFDFTDSFESAWQGSPEKLNAVGAVAVGLGLRALGHGVTAFDLRKDEFRFERRFQRLMPSLTLTSMLLGIAALLWSIHLYRESQSYAKEIAYLNAHGDLMYERFFEEPPKRNEGESAYDVALSKMTRRGRTSSKASKKTLVTVKPLNALGDFALAVEMARPRANPTWDSFDFNLEKTTKVKSTVRFTIGDFTEYNPLQSAVTRNVKMFDPPEFTYNAKGKENQVTVELRLKPEITGEGGKRGGR